MIDMKKQHRLWFLFSLALSAIVSISLTPQEDEAGPSCHEGERFEEKSQAIMRNRIQQIENVLNLTPREMKRLRVMLNGVVKEPFTHKEKLGDRTGSKIWKQYLDKAMTDQQLAELSEFDARKAEQRQAARLKYEANPKDTKNHAELAAANLQLNLFLTDQQTERVLELLNSYLSLPESLLIPPTWQSFYDSKVDEITDVLTESQIYFLQHREARQMTEQLSVASVWQQSKCVDCHVAAGGANNQ